MLAAGRGARVLQELRPPAPLERSIAPLVLFRMLLEICFRIDFAPCARTVRGGLDASLGSFYIDEFGTLRPVQGHAGAAHSVGCLTILTVMNCWVARHEDSAALVREAQVSSVPVISTPAGLPA